MLKIPRPLRKIFGSRPLRLLLYLVVVFLALNTAVGEYYERKTPARTQPSETQSQYYYRSLNLAQASQAEYTNQALKVTKNFGTRAKVQESLISFQVPKDGLTEYGLMTIPSGTPPKGGYPVLILCHGYANPHTYSTLKAYLSDMQFYSQHGFVVIKPDFRGQGYSISQGTADGGYYSMAYNTDVMSLIAAVKATDYLNHNDINIWGHSLGAYIALRAAVLSPDIKTAVLLSGPVGTSKDMFTLYQPISDTDNVLARRIRQDQLQKHGSPLSNPNFWYNASPLNFLSSTHAYIEIFVGQQDKIVPPEFSRDLDSALTNLHKPHDYISFSRGTHGLVPQRPVIWSKSLARLQAAGQGF